MGKKLSQASLKISKNEKKQLNSLIKVLRPKVYITDCSSFKKLVQELTGNNGSTITSPPPPTKSAAVEKVPVIEIDDHGDPESSMEMSVSSSELSNQTPFTEQSNQVYNNMYMGEMATLENSLTNQNADLLAYQDLESWLLDMEPFPFYNCYAQSEQEFSIYDYEFSGLI